MTSRFSAGGRWPSISAAFQPPAYHAQLTFRADRVSAMVLASWGGRGRWLSSVPLGSALSSGPSAAGGMPLG
jgi:hypothetical protein